MTELGPPLVERPVEVHGLAPERVLDGVGVGVPPPGVGAWMP